MGILSANYDISLLVLFIVLRGKLPTILVMSWKIAEINYKRIYWPMEVSDSKLVYDIISRSDNLSFIFSMMSHCLDRKEAWCATWRMHIMDRPCQWKHTVSFSVVWRDWSVPTGFAYCPLGRVSSYKKFNLHVKFGNL